MSTHLASSTPPTLAQGNNTPSMNLSGMTRVDPGYGWSCVAITKSDSTTYDPPLRGVYVGSVGDVAVLPVGNAAAVTFVGVPTGSYVWAVCTKVMSTGTSASSMVGLR